MKPPDPSNAPKERGPDPCAEADEPYEGRLTHAHLLVPIPTPTQSRLNYMYRGSMPSEDLPNKPPNLFVAQLERILQVVLKCKPAHNQGPKRPTMSEQEF